MDPVAFFTSSAVHIVAGKGGVGKTTLTAALGVAAASLGLEVLLVEIEGRGGLPALFGLDHLGYEETRLAERLHGRALRADQALIEYLTDHGLGLLARRMIDTGVVEVIARGAPGLKDILLLGKIKQLERARQADVILVDAPASGHAITFLRAPRGLLDAVDAGPINSQAHEVLELLTDGHRCQVLLVTTAEETPINELIETAYSLEEEVGLQLGPLLINGVLPRLELPRHASRSAQQVGITLEPERRRALEAAAAHRRRRQEAQAVQLDRLGERLALPRLMIHQQRTPPGPRTSAINTAVLAKLAENILAELRALTPQATSRPADSTRRPATPSLGESPPAVGPTGANTALAELVAQRSVIVCAGTGGVGKTSTAAALAMQAARGGRRAVVVTIDPAQRLADALGMADAANLANDVHLVPGPWSGELHAAMLDTKATFDALVRRYAADATQTESILANRFYRNISHSLSGTQEYMAAEKLFELYDSARFDLIVVDTPPSRQALDFLDAPGQLARFLDHRVYRLMIGSRRGGGASRAGLLGRAGVAVLRAASRLVGTTVMDDAATFFAAFDGMEPGFRQRSQQVRDLLASPAAAFVVVTAPQADTVVEAEYFLSQLLAQSLPVGALVVNRLTPRFTDTPSQLLAELAAAYPERGFGALVDNLAELTGIAEDQRDTQERLLLAAPGINMVSVTELDQDIHDLDGVEQLRAGIFGPIGTGHASS